MNYKVGNYISTEYGELPIKHVVFDSYQVTGKDGRTLWANKVEPIELTEEWLKILGFNRDDDTDYRWYIFDKSVAYDADDNCIRIADSWEFGKRKYVHQIQNLISELKPINV